MGVEELYRVPATTTSIRNLRDTVRSLTDHGRVTEYGLRASLNLLEDESVQIYDYTYVPGRKRLPISSYVIVLFNRDLGEITKSTMYKIDPANLTISKIESFDTKEETALAEEEYQETIDQFTRLGQELEETSWEELLDTHPGIAKRIKEKQDIAHQEEQAGLSFVSEAEIRDVIRRLGLIDPQSQTAV